MERTYTQLSLEERCQISSGLAEGRSIRQIAAALGRPPSAVAREVKRNAGRKIGYQPAYAAEQARARRWSGSKLARDPKLQEVVLDNLKRGISPEQIAGRMKRENAPERVSHETIYRFVYAEIARTKDYAWRLLLPRAKSKRGWRGRRGGSPASFIQGRASIENRDPAARDRAVPGHWEADLMSFAKYGQFVLTLHERNSRLVIAARPETKSADHIAEMFFDWLRILPAPLRQSLTFDNGTEFARHYQLHPLGTATFFCDPHAPWQKGGIENAHGRLRRHLPRKTDLDTIGAGDLNRFLRAYNSTPRKCLDYRTPAEVFIEQVLHFECEFTSPPSRG